MKLCHAPTMETQGKHSLKIKRSTKPLHVCTHASQLNLLATSCCSAPTGHNGDDAGWVPAPSSFTSTAPSALLWRGRPSCADKGAGRARLVPYSFLKLKIRSRGGVGSAPLAGFGHEWTAATGMREGAVEEAVVPSGKGSPLHGGWRPAGGPLSRAGNLGARQTLLCVVRRTPWHMAKPLFIILSTTTQFQIFEIRLFKI